MMPYLPPLASLGTMASAASQGLVMGVGMRGQSMPMHGMHYWPPPVLPPHMQRPQQFVQFGNEQAGPVFAFGGAQFMPVHMYPMYQAPAKGSIHPGANAHGLHSAQQFGAADYSMFWQPMVGMAAHPLPQPPPHQQGPQQQQGPRQRKGRAPRSNHGNRFSRPPESPQQQPQ